MMSRWHFKVAPEDWWQKLLRLLADKDIRSTAGWFSSGFGLFMICGYYLWLGFTPVFGLGQATLLVLQACVVGFFVTVYLAFVLFMPAMCYRVLSVDIEDFPRGRQSAAISSLALRSIAAQACLLSCMFMVLIFKVFSLDGSMKVYAGSSLVVFICSGVVLWKLPCTSKLGGPPESLTKYCWSLFILGGAGIVAAWMLYSLYSIPIEKDRAAAEYFIVGLTLVVVISALISTLRKKHRSSGFLIGGLVFMYLLFSFNSGTMPFKATVVSLGIAVTRPVEIILPEPTCSQIKLALSDQNGLNCKGSESGRLKNIHLLNTLGERWVIREEGHVENIIFDGKGVVVRTLPPKSNK